MMRCHKESETITVREAIALAQPRLAFRLKAGELSDQVKTRLRHLGTFKRVVRKTRPRREGMILAGLVKSRWLNFLGARALGSRTSRDFFYRDSLPWPDELGE